jgi:ribonuclease P protein component
MGRATAVQGLDAEVRRLLKRSQFLRAARGNRAGRSAFVLQAVESDETEPGIGFTVTKKTGNAPERNRIKRRLREAARACEAAFRPRHDYVLVGRRDALTVPFDKLIAELSGAITKIHASKAKGLRDDK